MDKHFATGMRFEPSDRQKIDYLLKYKINGKPPSDDYVYISTVDLYGEKEPWEIFNNSRNDEIYFFTRLKRSTNAGRQFRRDIGRGMWQICGPIMNLLDIKGKAIGFGQSYVYKSEKNSDQDGKWIMIEWTLDDDAFKSWVKHEYADYALCSVKKYRDRYVSGQEMGSLDIESFFDQMLDENSIMVTSSSSSSTNDLSLINSVDQENSDDEVILINNEFYHNSPSLNLELCGYKKR